MTSFYGANQGGINSLLALGQGGAFGQAAGHAMGLNNMEAIAALPGVAATKDTAAAQLAEQARQFNQQDLRRQQMLDLLGLSPQTMGPGGLLGGTFFQSILGNTVPDVVGGITGALPGGGGQMGQPGFADSPGGAGASPSGGGGNSLFNQQIAGRGQLGRDILSDISQFGGSRRAEIDRNYSNLGNSALARLDARGLGSSNLGTSVMRGVERDRQGARGALEDQLLSQQIGAKQQIGEGLFGDIGKELDRGVERQRTGASLLNALLGSAFNTVSL